MPGYEADVDIIPPSFLFWCDLLLVRQNHHFHGGEMVNGRTELNVRRLSDERFIPGVFTNAET